MRIASLLMILSKLVSTKLTKTREIRQILFRLKLVPIRYFICRELSVSFMYCICLLKAADNYEHRNKFITLLQL